MVDERRWVNRIELGERSAPPEGDPARGNSFERRPAFLYVLQVLHVSCLLKAVTVHNGSKADIEREQVLHMRSSLVEEIHVAVIEIITRADDAQLALLKTIKNHWF